MINRLALFVEGYSEVVFAEKLIEEIAGKNKVAIEWYQIRGGTTTQRTMARGKGSKSSSGQDYYVLIYDCVGDHQVKPRIVEEHENLTKKGYQKIIGIRDVRPSYSHANLADLEAMLPKYIKTKLIPVEWVLAILEVEAWFLSEAGHFSRIDPAITTEAIKSNLGFDPENDPMDQRLLPAEDMQNCYALGGKVYEKRNAQLTVEALDYAVVFMQLSTRIPYLKKLCDSVEAFLGT